MNVIGINSGLHDAAACLLMDGRIAAFSAEERFSRKKHDGRFPIDAIRFCLNQAGLTFRDIDAVAYGWDYFKYETDKLRYHIGKTLEIAATSQSAAIDYLTKLRARKEQLYKTFDQVNIETRKYFDCEFIKVDHHVAHAFSAFPLSGFDRSAVLVIDGSGEVMTTSLWHYQNNAIRFLKSYDLPDSLGVFYGAMTQFLGFIHHDEEWKVMGWAPYGRPRFYEAMKNIVSIDTLKLNIEYFQFSGECPWYSRRLTEMLGVPPRSSDAEFDEVYADIAASTQKLLEECVLVLAQEIRNLTHETQLCMAGGVALNGKANGRVLDEFVFDKIFVQPAAADDGVALGAAMKVAYDKGDDIFHAMGNVYLGAEFQDDAYARALEASRLLYKKFNSRELVVKVAEYLSNGAVVGWFQGRSEVGPRALGNRSILADPRDPEMKNRLNSKIKFREPFRPFAPSVMEEHAEEYFEGNLSNAFHMNQIFKVKKEKQSRIPAVTHIDETARIQVVSHCVNRRYHCLLQAFYKKTGVPVLVNTSFNVKGEPIVNSPEEAVECFLKTGIDVLVLGNNVSVKESF